MNISFSIKKEYLFFFLVALVWSNDILLQFARAILLRVPFLKLFPDVCIYSLYTLAAISCKKIYKINLFDSLFLSIIIITLFVERLFYPETAEYLDHYIITFMCVMLPVYVLGSTISKLQNSCKEKLFTLLYHISALTIILSIIYNRLFALPMNDITSLYSGNMNLAYNLLPHCCYVAYWSVKKTSIVSVALSVISGIYLSMLGTRGALLIFLFSLVVFLIIFKNFYKLLFKLIPIVVPFGIFIYSNYFDQFIQFMYIKTSSLGLSVRIFDKYLNGDLSNQTGRDYIRDFILQKVNENPLLGNGLCFDRLLIGTYPHNIVLELWCDFGLIIGTAVLVLMMMMILRALQKIDNEMEKGFVWALVCASFFKLFLSGSYLDENRLFLLLGICGCYLNTCGLKRASNSYQ